MHHDVTIDRVLKNTFKCSGGLGFVLCIKGVLRLFVLYVLDVSCYIGVPYLRSENNLGRVELLSHMTVHVGATFCQSEDLTFGVRVID